MGQENIVLSYIYVYIVLDISPIIFGKTNKSYRRHKNVAPEYQKHQ